MIGSPTNSSISKGAGGSPRTATSGSMGHKVGQSSSLSLQQTKNPSSMPPRSHLLLVEGMLHQFLAIIK